MGTLNMIENALMASPGMSLLEPCGILSQLKNVERLQYLGTNCLRMASLLTR